MAGGHQLRLYNSLGRRMEDFTPSADVTGMYSCGPTVYAFPHLGNMRPVRVRRHAAPRLPLERHRGPAHRQHHRRRARGRGHRHRRGQARGRGGPGAPFGAGHRRVLHGRVLHRHRGAEHPARRRVPAGQRLRRADDRVRAQTGQGRLHLPAALGPVLRHVQGPRLRRAGPDEHRRPAGGGPAGARGGAPPQDRLRPVAGRGTRQAPGAALGLTLGLGRARMAPGVLGDEHGPARLALRPAHRRRRPPGAAPRQRDRAEPGLPRRR